jgi:hypothetical protein
MAASSNALTLARPLIRVLIWLNAIYALAIGGLLLFSFLNPAFFFKALGGGSENSVWELRNSLRAVVVLGLAGAYIAWRVLRELLAIVDTVRDGDPFVAQNARRLQAIAWWVLAGEGVRLMVGAVAYAAAKAAPELRMDIDVGFSFAPWLAVLLLFVLARVFDLGTRMRADLEGTV